MSTRSTISYLDPNGGVQQIYCHYDGYPSHTGALLKEHYSNPTAAGGLVDLGDLSYLAENLYPEGEHSFRKPESGVCVFYGRDRGETGTDPKHFESFEDYKEYNWQEEYNYIYIEDLDDWFLVTESFEFVPF